MNPEPPIPVRMPFTRLLLPEFDHETGTTRRLLERVPDAALGWKPHERSMSMGELATPLARLVTWTPAIVEGTAFDLVEARERPRPPVPDSGEAIVALFDENIRAARAVFAGTSDEAWLVPWSLRDGGHLVFTVPRVSAFRTFVLNHSVHHRGQLSVYLRLNDVRLPAIYGPTADEQ
jgi:uncharacterized damage-inducible protein DinB